MDKYTECKDIAEKIFENGNSLLREIVAKRFSKKTKEREELANKFEQIENKICNNEYTSLDFNKWLYDLSEVLYENHSRLNSEDKLKISLKDVFPLIEGIAKTRSSKLKQRLTKEFISMMQSRESLDKWDSLVNKSFNKQPPALAILLLKFHKLA